MHNKLSEQLKGQGLAGSVRLTETGQEITLNFPAGSPSKHATVTLGPVTFEAEIHLAVNGDASVDDPNDLALVIKPLMLHVPKKAPAVGHIPSPPQPLSKGEMDAAKTELTQMEKDVADLPPPVVDVPVQVEQIKQVAIPPPVPVQNTGAPATNRKKR